MAQTQAEQDEAFLEFILGRGVISALEAETLRTEIKRRRAADKKDLTMAGLIAYKGIVGQEQAEHLRRVFEGGATAEVPPAQQPTRRPTGKVKQPTGSLPQQPAPPAAIPVTPASQLLQAFEPTLVPLASDDEYDDDSEVVTSTAPIRPQPPSAEQVQPAPADKVKERTAPGSAPVPAKTTDRVKDSRVSTGRSTTAKTTAQGSKKAGWNLSDDADVVAATDKLVPAGTVIMTSEMTIAQVRHQMGIQEDVKLVSNKMESTLAQFQPDAAAERKRYVVVREIARGGMGKVLEVEDTELRRSVALKVLRKELLGRRDVVERFLEEAQITGQLEHPNIVPVHEMGVDGAGNLYFTMKFVEGLSLAEILLKLREGNRDTMREYPLWKLLDTFLKICEGLSFAHNRGVIHRDLKPANVMVGRFGEVQLMDWGVAKIVGREYRPDGDSKIVLTDRLDGGATHTMVGAIIGTPSYMAPEQARGDVENIGPAADLFSLGVILYEMLALRSPWTGKTSDEVLQQVRELEPQKPSERNPSATIPAELERLCMKCLVKDSSQRIGSVAELSENIRSYMEGRTMGAVEYSPMKLLLKWVGRHKRDVIGVVLSLLLLAGGVAATIWYLGEQDRKAILGLSDDATKRIGAVEEFIKEQEFDAAEALLDDCNDMYQRVLAVEPEDEAARQGIADITEWHRKLRDQRIAAQQAAAGNERRGRLLEAARNGLIAAESQKHLVMAQEGLLKALAETDAVLAEDPKHEAALDLKARIAHEFARKALDASQWDVCDLMLKVLRATGLMREQQERLAFELQRRRPG
ncbi:MAG: protein kinase [Planctomycetes bacterium]|nr:protein kinase [Planctomycetota bacterium]